VSFGVELLQIYFPPRIPSLVDCSAQMVGAGLGVVFWSAWGGKFLAWLAGFRSLNTTPSLAMRVLMLYGAGLLAYGLFPLDLSLSLADLYRKWRSGHILLVPFAEWRHVDALILDGFFADVALWLPVGFLGRLSFSRLKWFIVLIGTIAAAFLEFLQLFVLSRTTDATQVIAACAGTMIGVMLAIRFTGEHFVTAPTRQAQGSQIQGVDFHLLLAAVGWFILICAVFWYPYDFQLAPTENIASELLSSVFLESMFYQTELRAVTELLRKTLFFAPLGALIALSMSGHRKHTSRFLRLLAAALALFAAVACVEYGKLYLPGRFPGITNGVLEFVGGLMGYWAAMGWAAWRLGLLRPISAVSPTLSRNTPLPSAQEMRQLPPASTAVRELPIAKAACIVLSVGTLLWLLTKLPQVPYNFRNLPYPTYPYISMLLVAGALVWSSGLPAWIDRRLRSDRRAFASYPLWLVLYGLTAWILIFFAVEPLRAQKLVGTPILHWPWHFEWLLRFLALMAGIGAFAVLGCIVGGESRDRGRRLAIWFLHGAWLLPLIYWAVIVEAATDNIVELLDGNASPWAALLAGLVITTMFAAAARLRDVFSGVPVMRRLLALIVVLLSFPLGYGLTHMATEPVIVKYGKVFSGMQFILSADREHYAQGGMLVLRYCLFHLFFVLAAATGTWLFLERPLPTGRER
jgi:VanZ family protein